MAVHGTKLTLVALATSVFGVGGTLAGLLAVTRHHQIICGPFRTLYVVTSEGHVSRESQPHTFMRRTVRALQNMVTSLLSKWDMPSIASGIFDGDPSPCQVGSRPRSRFVNLNNRLTSGVYQYAPIHPKVDGCSFIDRHSLSTLSIGGICATSCSTPRGNPHISILRDDGLNAALQSDVGQASPHPSILVRESIVVGGGA